MDFAELIHEKTFSSGKKLGVYGAFEAPLFLAKNVIEALEEDFFVLISKIDEDEKLQKSIMIENQLAEFLFVTKYGLCQLLILSNNINAVFFKIEMIRFLKQLQAFEKLQKETLDQLKELDLLIKMGAEAFNMLNCDKNPLNNTEIIKFIGHCGTEAKNRTLNICDFCIK